MISDKKRIAELMQELQELRDKHEKWETSQDGSYGTALAYDGYFYKLGELHELLQQNGLSRTESDKED